MSSSKVTTVAEPFADAWGRPDIRQALRLCSQWEAQSGAATRPYYTLLNRFVSNCHRLVHEGFPYLVVVLCHELYRFLYPMDSYANFTHDDPVSNVTKRIERLIRLSEVFPGAVAPYSLELEDSQGPANTGVVLEKVTSALYTSFWKTFDQDTLSEESAHLLRGRLPEEVLEQRILGKDVLDMGCGSGRYTIALAMARAKTVAGLDLERKAFSAADQWCRHCSLPVNFVEGNVHQLPFAGASFDFVFCNGVLHHSASINRGLEELFRVLRSSGCAFLYLYAAGGLFWRTRVALRGVFSEIPIDYTSAVLRLIGMPSNRFIFCDTWYVPREVHTSREDLESMLTDAGFSFRKIVSSNPFDLDRAIETGIPSAADMWGDGEHRYILAKRA